MNYIWISDIFKSKSLFSFWKLSASSDYTAWQMATFWNFWSENGQSKFGVHIEMLDIILSYPFLQMEHNSLDAPNSAWRRTPYVCIGNRGGWLLEFYIPATSKVMSGWVPTCVHSWQLYSAVSVENQISPTQTHYADAEWTSPSPILLMPSTSQGSDRYHFDKSLVLTRPWTELPISYRRGSSATDSANTMYQRAWLESNQSLVNLYLSHPSQVLSITTIGQGLVGSVSG